MRCKWFFGLYKSAIAIWLHDKSIKKHVSIGIVIKLMPAFMALLPTNSYSQEFQSYSYESLSPEIFNIQQIENVQSLGITIDNNSLITPNIRDIYFDSNTYTEPFIGSDVDTTPPIVVSPDSTPPAPRLIPLGPSPFQIIDEGTIGEVAQKLQKLNPDLSVLGEFEKVSSSTEHKKCRQAFEVLAVANHYCGNDECSEHRQLSSAGSETLVKQFDEAAAAFDRACLVNVPIDGFWAGDTGLDTVKALASEVVGVLASPSFFCGGILINSDRVLTARHCFYDVDDRLRERSSYSELENNEVFFYRVNKPKEKYTILSLVGFDEGKEGPIYYSEDYVILQLSVSVGETPKVVLQDPELGEQQWLVGHYVHFDRSWVSDTVPQDAMYQWFHGLRTSRENTCFVETSQEGCVLHTCQSQKGFSGGPLINLTKSTKDQLVLSGLLVSSGDSNQACSSTTGNRNALNLAIGSSLFVDEINFLLN